MYRMIGEKHLLLVAMFASVLLAGGCRTATSHPGARTRAEKPTRTAAPAPVSKGNGTKLATAHAHFAAGVVHELNGETDLALEEFQKAVRDDPDNEPLVLDVSRRFLQSKRPDNALGFMHAATERPNASGEMFARLGIIYSRLGSNELAAVANRMAIKKSPGSLEGHRNLFFSLLQARQSDEALKVLDEAAKQDSKEAEFFCGLADLYQNFALQFPTQREATSAKMLALLNRAESLKPKSPQTRLRIAEGFYALGKNDQAAVLFLPLLDQLDELPMIRENVRAKLADIYLRGDDHKRAREQLEALVHDDPSNAQAHYFLGSLAYNDKNWTNAIDSLNKTLLFNQNFEPAYYDLAAAQIAADQADDALSTIETAQKKFPKNFISEYLAGLAHGHKKEFPAAIRHFASAEIIAQAGEPKRLTGPFYFEVGVVHERGGDRAEAVKYFEKCLELQPDFPEAQNYLGYMWAEQGENLDRARELIEKALRAEPKSAAYLDSMAWVLYKLEQPKPALEYILKSVELSEGPDATLYDHLGDIYAALNEPDQARAAWLKSLAVERNETVHKKLDALKRE